MYFFVFNRYKKALSNYVPKSAYISCRSILLFLCVGENFPFDMTLM